MIGKILRGGINFKWSLVDQFFVSGGNFLSVALCANYLTIDDQGKLGFILTWYFGSIIINNGAIFQHASVKYPSEPDSDQYLGKLAWVQLALAIVFSVIVSLLILGFSVVESFSLSIVNIGLILIFLLFQQLADFSRRTAYIFRDSLYAVKLSSMLYSSRILLLLYFEPDNITNVLLILVATSVFSVINAISIVVNTKYLLLNIWEFSKVHFTESKWFIRTGPVLWLWSSVPMFMLGSMIDAAAMAVFFTIRSLSNMSNVVMELLETEFAARLGRYQHLDGKMAVKAVRHVQITGLVLWFLGLLVVIVYGDELISLIFGTQYAEYSEILTLFWMSNGVTFLHRLNAVHIRTSGKSKAVMKAYTLGVLTMPVIGMPLISIYGLLGGVWLAMISELVILLGQLGFSRGVQNKFV